MFFSSMKRAEKTSPNSHHRRLCGTKGEGTKKNEAMKSCNGEEAEKSTIQFYMQQRTQEI